MLIYGVIHVVVEQGLMELRKLNIEQRLWEASRKEVDQDSFTPVAIKSAGKSKN